MSDNRSNEFPKVIWFLWLQGIDNDTPKVVHECLKSWQKHHKSWKIEVLNSNNVTDLIPEVRDYLENEKISAQAQSDIIRIMLLEKYGGVWVDATTYCTKPLDSWLFNHLNSDFFAFTMEERFFIDSWFLAAYKGSYIMKKWRQEVERFWSASYLIPLSVTKWYQWFYFGIINKTPKRWKGFTNGLLKRFLFPVRVVLGTYPYFWIHYSFDYCILKDKSFKKLWYSSNKLSAKDALFIQAYGLEKKPTEEISKFIDDEISHIHKLDWRKSNIISPNSNANIISYLIVK